MLTLLGLAVAASVAAALPLAVRVGRGGEGRVSRAAFRAQMARPRPAERTHRYGFQLTVLE